MNMHLFNAIKAALINYNPDLVYPDRLIQTIYCQLVTWDPSLEDEFEEKRLLDNPILYLSILMMLLHFLNEAFKEKSKDKKAVGPRDR